MVRGLLTFEQYFRTFSDQYIIIGGTACDLLIHERGGDFRATQDLDMVLIIDALTPAFGEALWSFIREGGYEIWRRQDEIPQYYRFVRPKSDQYPQIIELFSRRPDYISPSADVVLSPIHVDDDISSLSAILLNDVYYDFMCTGQVYTAEPKIPVLDIPHLIAFKIRAWLDLNERMLRDEHVDSKNIKKHKNDVFRLSAYVQPDLIMNVPSEIYTDIEAFCSAMEREAVDLKQLGLGKVRKEDALQVLRELFAKE